ncbi:B12-binding domain-containing radical SAM protein [Rhodoferax lacus]|uniref:B12-binding domain-containing radical SAM protein n=1 Tax=Rhodoferax lacus TaxID=2184758 RepID=A0A3E1R6E3_9BURK|nr:DUF4080 domain-containing protein [Rhodoferax lacus]RFO94948.1 B12-binding domain-containing radical SAM protein [Rhodoferax lacus]
MSARIVLATLNAKYIHASLGLRCLMANMQRHGGADLAAMTCLQEFTIQRPAGEIVESLLQSLGDADVRVVGLGVYIWNVTQTTEVVRLLKERSPDVKIVLGGPEVSHELEGQTIVQLADHVITGWGDVSFPKLCRALVLGPQPLMKVIAGEQPPLDALDLPYTQYSDTDLAQRVLYVEASRGCPFKCAFCLSALDKTAWAFELEPFLAELATLYARGARNFKFVDRTFNLKVDTSVRILQFFLDRLRAAPGDSLFLHFELVPDHLPDALKALVAQFPAGVLQFEIGIQSFNPAVQSRIARRQDNAKTEDNIRWLLAHTTAHLHTDLIFGLPGEDWQSFADGFDRLYALGPHEIQLGVLKRLRGTPLARRSLPGAVAEDGMQYATEPPYTVLQTDAVSASEVQQFVRLARYWDLLVNSGRFGQSSRLLLQGPSAFAAWADFSQWLWQRTASTHQLTPELLLDALFDYLTLERALPMDAVRAALLADYLASGARSNPQCLQGLLPRREKTGPQKAGVAQRQMRHQASAAQTDTAGSKIDA